MKLLIFVEAPRQKLHSTDFIVVTAAIRRCPYPSHQQPGAGGFVIAVSGNGRPQNYLTGRRHLMIACVLIANCRKVRAAAVGKSDRAGRSEPSWTRRLEWSGLASWGARLPAILSIAGGA